MDNKTRINIQDRESPFDVKIISPWNEYIECTVSEELMLSFNNCILEQKWSSCFLIGTYLDFVAFLIFAHSLHIQECLCSKTL